LDDLLEAEYIQEGDTVATSFSKNNVQAIIVKNNGRGCFKWNEDFYRTPGKLVNDVAKSIGLKGGRNGWDYITHNSKKLSQYKADFLKKQRKRK